jgi:hypothetical protein
MNIGSHDHHVYIGAGTEEKGMGNLWRWFVFDLFLDETGSL